MFSLHHTLASMTERKVFDMTRRLGAVCSWGTFFADDGFGNFIRVDTVAVVNWFESQQGQA
jgi:hypothetical protein